MKKFVLNIKDNKKKEDAMKKNLRTICLTLLITFFVQPVASQGKMVDQYRQMGGVAALAEMCLSQKRLESQLFKSVGMSVYNNPGMGRTLLQLMAFYFEGYQMAKEKRVVWNGTQQKYNNKRFSCKSQSDLSIIKKFEAQMFGQLAAK